MEIKRYCGRERLPGGTRRWRRLARAVGFTGNLQLQGFGIGGEPGRVHRRLVRGDVGLLTWGDFSPGEIRVWLKCKCAVGDPEDMDEAEAGWGDGFVNDQEWLVSAYAPLRVFAHELGHHAQWRKNKNYYGDEAAADRFGTLLLAHIQ